MGVIYIRQDVYDSSEVMRRLQKDLYTFCFFIFSLQGDEINSFADSGDIYFCVLNDSGFTGNAGCFQYFLSKYGRDADIRSNITGVTSMQGIDICWVEEASTVTDESWEVLIPTIRKPESEIWVTFNPRFEDDAVWTRFVIRKPTDCILIECNYIANPWFPDVHEQERLDCLRMTPKLYEHTWLGKFKSGIDGGDFDKEWFILDQTHSLEPNETNAMTKYMVIDPSRTQSATSDFTAMAVIGLNDDGNRYVLEVVRDKLTIDGRYKELKRLYKKWNVRDVHYKKTAAESEIEAMKLFQ